MKLVQLLAKELKEWPENSLGYFPACFIAQDNDGLIVTLDPEEKPDADQFNGRSWSRSQWTGRDLTFEVAEDHETSIINRDQWHAEREKMNKPKWIRARGKKPNYDTEYPQRMQVRHRDGSTTSGWTSQSFNWSYLDGAPDADIMAYCVLPLESKDQEIKEVKDMNLGTLSIAVDASDVSKPMIASMKEMDLEWGQIESPLKWRDEIIELEAYEEEFRREREKLIRKLESEGFKLIDQINCNLDKIDQTLESSVDMSDWRNWEVGDIVLIKNDPDVADGEHEITDLEGNDYDGDLPVQAGGGWADFSEATVKFIRRP